jgi:hypothetical protein
MHRPETKIEMEVEILCNKPSHSAKSIKNQCIGLTGEYREIFFFSTASGIFGEKTELFQ